MFTYITFLDVANIKSRGTGWHRLDCVMQSVIYKPASLRFRHVRHTHTGKEIDQHTDNWPLYSSAGNKSTFAHCQMLMAATVLSLIQSYNNGQPCIWMDNMNSSNNGIIILDIMLALDDIWMAIIKQPSLSVYCPVKVHTHINLQRRSSY